ncbi:MAG: xanthine dehydrogenase accessory protein XdhC [Planctomycetota bacterium]
MTFDVMQHSRKLRQLVEDQTPFACITMVAVRGSAPQVVGAKAIVTPSGLDWGTVGGGKIEAAAIAHAQRLLTSQDQSSCDLVTWNLQTDIGMTCGGEVKLFFEAHGRADWPIAIFGAGHVVQALVPMLLQLNCRVTCIDPRAEWLSRLPSHPRLTTCCAQEPLEVVKDQPEHAFFVLMSKGHATDLPVLAEILATRQPPYLGVIGSAQKASVLRRDLKQRGISDQQIDSFHCPIGLPIGNNTPVEISVSVIAQLIQKRDEISKKTNS